jgi:hypothetical protein
MWHEWQAPTLEHWWRKTWGVGERLLGSKETSALTATPGQESGLEGEIHGEHQGKEKSQTQGGLELSSDQSLQHSLSDARTSNKLDGVVCHYLGGLEIDRRNYAQDSSQNGSYIGAMAGGLCSSERDQVNFTLQNGLDRASDSARAGGNQQRQEFKAQWLHAFGENRWGLEWGQQRLLDAQIYSELLGSVVRNTMRQNIRLSLDYKITQNLGMMDGSLHWVSFWETLRYRSSVDLFNMRGQSIQTGVKWDF